MSKPLLQAKEVFKSYILGRSPLHVLRGASLDVQAGEFVAVMGASGSGKSTLLHIMGALDLPDKGRVLFKGRSVFDLPGGARERLRNTEVGFIFQFYHLLPELNVFENILLPHMVGHSVPGWWRTGRRARRSAEEVMDSVGLSARARHRPNELSGGERQRAAIARAIVTSPRLLLADEPTGNLDRATGKEILAVLARLNQRGQTIVMVTHDPQVAGLAHRVVELVDGRMKEAKAPVR
ncbi:MAG: ABC transporter ATP-binding protein [Planctomycetota bacterium]|jgi:ABC-type lipoprotein export system ATPase subunit